VHRPSNQARKVAVLELSAITRKLPARVEPLKVLGNNTDYRRRAFNVK
jgi:hypothetical protein